MIVRIQDRNDWRDGQRGHWHGIDTRSDTPVIVQVYDGSGALVPLPGAGPAIRQEAPNVYIPCLYESYYPLTVVMVK